MNKIHKLIEFTIEILFLTNVWVIIYTQLITYLNFLHPPVMKEEFYRPAAAFPEPFEMPLYLILTFAFVLFIWFLHKYFFKSLDKFDAIYNKNKFLLIIKVLILIFLLVLFLTKLAKFPLADDPYPYNLRPNPSIYLFILFLYFAFSLFIIFISVLLSRLIKNKKLYDFIFYTGALTVSAVLTFEPRFPISSHEYGYFFGPMWEVISGKTLFTNIATDYGFYATLFFTALYKIGVFSFSQLPIYVWLMFIAQYFLSFYLVYKISRSLPLSLIALFSIITVNYFSFFVLPITITQYSAMRRLPSVFLLFLLYKFKKFDSRFLLLMALTDFWIVDSGISILLAFGFTLFILLLKKMIMLKVFFKTLLKISIFQIGVFILINAIHILFAYKPISPFDILQSLRQHAGLGLTMLPIQSHNFFWIVILIYFASIIYFFKQSNRSESEIPGSNKNRVLFGAGVEPGGGPKRSGNFQYEDWDEGETGPAKRMRLSLLLFSANLSLFGALYFVGRSHEANLIDISIIVILNFFVLTAILWNKITSVKIKALLSFLIFILFIIYPAYSRRYHLTEFALWKFNRIADGNIFIPETDQILKKNFSEDVNLIKKQVTDNEIVILSKEETYLLFLSGKKNLLDVNPQSAIDTVSEMNIATKRAVEKCPIKIAADCRLFKKCPEYESYSQKSLFMAPIILEKLEKNCQVKYQPTVCTDKLCIATIKQ